ncbi:MAG: DNA recombination protein RmuC, partial [Clostridia bacterium]|nr:DNA recombination protein RmuC [Clostridia bacterium]
MLTAVLIVASIALALSLGTAILAIVLLVRSRKATPVGGSEELNRQLNLNNDNLVKMLTLHNQTVDDNLRKTLSYAQENTERQNRQTEELSAKTGERLDAMSKNLSDTLSNQRMEMTAGINALRESMAAKQAEQARTTQEALAGLRQEINGQLKDIRDQNAKEMNEMRAVVDKQLHENLENRLTQSFGLVTDKLSEVYKGLGEMSALTTDVNALKNVLSGVKTRGTWGEISLRTLLEQLLTTDQYVTNFHASRAEGGVVEFAIKMPGPEGSPVYLPLDSKFPLEDYQRLVEAAQAGDQAAVEANTKALYKRVRDEAMDIRDKYLRPPKTTDFGVLYLP